MVEKNAGNTLFTQLHIKTERLIIRPYQLQDTDDLFHACSDPHFYDHIPGETTPSLHEIEKIIKWSMDCNHKNRLDKIYKLNLAIVYRASGKVIGYCGLGPYDLDESKIEIYYGISKEFQGMGIASEAAKAILNCGFTLLGLDEITTTVFPSNHASIKVLHKIGMKYQYTLEDIPEQYEYFKGFDYYSISRQDFEKNN